jgi:KAP family P-loop domain
MRIILFIQGSASGQAGDTAADWASLERIAQRLQSHVAIVAAPQPRSFELDPGPRRVSGFDPRVDWSELRVGAPGSTSIVQAYQPTALRGDRPARRDALGYGAYASALASFLLHPLTEPMTIGVQGPWGKGKSTFMGFIKDALIRGARASQGSKELLDLDAVTARLALAAPTNDPNREAARKKDDRDLASAQRALARRASGEVVCAEFNAWQFEATKEIWSGLARTISVALEASRPWYLRAAMRLAYPFRLVRSQTWVVAALLLLLGSAGLLLALYAALPEQTAALIQFTLPANAPVLPQPFGTLLALALLGGSIWRLIRPLGDGFARLARSPAESRPGYQARVVEDLRYARDAWRRKPAPRVVVFIDDLDRCSEDRIVDVLQAIHLILAQSDFYVVMGIDTEMIHRAIRQHYLAQPGAEKLPADFANAYLEKIIQLPFHLPESSPEDRDRFTRSIFGWGFELPASEQASRSVRAGPGDVPFDLGAVLPISAVERLPVEITQEEQVAFGVFQAFIADNPRQLIRLVNLHRLVKIMVHGSGPVPSVERQRKLVKWLTFCVRWPDLVARAISAADGPTSPANILAGLARTRKNRPVDAASLLAFANAEDPSDYLEAADLAENGELRRAATFAALVADHPQAPAADQPPA